MGNLLCRPKEPTNLALCGFHPSVTGISFLERHQGFRVGSHSNGDGVAAKVREAVEYRCRGVLRFSQSLDSHFVALISTGLQAVSSTVLRLVFIRREVQQADFQL